ncbi:LLM class F420-dependent oxidoreductase [Streptomyces sp. NPDC048282]|uniref:LLM class F420-dependent oxidoreductase n=1 Tax=Streptomyces sp. NPDC048282 TaxID=3365528 RepID=UPI003715FCCD
MDDVKTAAPRPIRLKESIGRYGLWSIALRVKDPAKRTELNEAATELEELGYRAVWLGGSPSVQHARLVIEETTRLMVGTSILTIWEHEPQDLAQEFAAIEDAHPGRLLLGLGVAHHISTERYHRPYSAMVDYLDALDAKGQPAERRLLAALGPKMLRLAGDRSAGSIPYLVTPEHTAQARRTLGEDPLLAPEVKVVLDTDPDRARTIARLNLQGYLVLPNYTNNLLRSGFTEEDLADGGSDRLIDALVAWGDEGRVKERLDAFLAAGADHVAVQLITEDPIGLKFFVEGQPLDARLREGWRRLADALLR